MNLAVDFNNESQIRRLFSWQTRVGLAPKFGSRPIGWYQQHQMATFEILTKCGCSDVRVVKGNIVDKALGMVATVYSIDCLADRVARHEMTSDKAALIAIM